MRIFHPLAPHRDKELKPSIVFNPLFGKKRDNVNLLVEIGTGNKVKLLMYSALFPMTSGQPLNRPKITDTT